ncbi:hypothetical protein [Streptomyces sp. NBC_00038]|uniref:hypothetical protein n=1 Tax=Streptomyces sp. NBC_00038 TaxID=2903615 RepID=UPI002254ECD9|nr:hypothetical protein [Streptomyces sp. NBC_00038]MCX5561361.1 hypothetical protein [Streptomyces sp. NBC_00038]
MREKPDVGAESVIGEEAGKKRLDLSVPQVAGSAVAAVVAAKLASYFGVYGTMLGAGLVSVVATCGGTVFQHFFKRTGEQIRDVTVQARPRAQQAPAAGEFTEGTVYRARARSWRRPVVAAALVFGVTMAGITSYELVSGHSFSGDGRSTTVGDALKGSGSNSTSEPGTSSTSSTSGTTPSAGSSSAQPSGGSGAGATQDDGGANTPTPTPSSSATPQAGDDTPTPTPSATATSPAPGASSRSQSADPGQADPSAR